MKKILSLLLSICIATLLLPQVIAESGETDFFFPEEGKLAILSTGGQAVAVVAENGDLCLHYFEHDDAANLYVNTSVSTKLMSGVKMIASSSRTLLVLRQNGSLWVYKFSYNREDIFGPLELMDDISEIAENGEYHFSVLSETGTLSDIETNYVYMNTSPVPEEYIITQIDTEVPDIYTNGLYIKGSEVRRTAYAQSELVKALDFSDGVKVWSHNKAYFVLTEAGDLWSWGSNARGQLGNGGQYDGSDRIIFIGEFQDGYMAYPVLNSKPTKILTNVEDMWFGNSEIRAVDQSGTVWQWGDGENIMAYIEMIGDRSYSVRDIQYPEGFPNCLGYFPRTVTPSQWISPIDFIDVLYTQDGGIWVKLNGNDDFSCVIPGRAPDDPSDEPEIPDLPTEPSTPSEGPEINDSPTGFSDIPPEHYCVEPVIWAVEQEITSGTSETTFSPDAPCTRAQAVTFLWRASGSPTPENPKNPFVDVSENAYYYEAVLWAVENRITLGTSSSTFSPDEKCTRAQIVTFLWRLMEPDESSAVNVFADVGNSDYFYLPVCWAVENGITMGMGNNRFVPHDFCTRGQIVTFLYRTLKNA